MRPFLSRCFFLVVLLSSTIALAGPVKVFELRRLPAQDTLVTGWKWRHGDQKEWSRPNLNDSDWKSFDPSADINQVGDQKGIYWLRLHLKVDSTLGTHDLSFAVEQSVASEIYVDGKLLTSFGQLLNGVQAYDPLQAPVHVVLVPGDHTVAVRIAFQQDIPATRPQAALPVFELRLNAFYRAAANYDHNQELVQTANLVYSLLAGIYFIVFATFFALYIYNRNRAYLYYTLACFDGMYNCILGVVLLLVHSPGIMVWLSVFSLLSNTGMFFITLTVYALFEYPKRGFVWLYVAVSLISAVVIMINGTAGMYLFTMLLPLLNVVENVRVAVWARRQRKKGALFVMAGVISFFSLFLLGLFLPFFYIGMIVYVIALVSFPIGMAIFLAIGTASTNRTLEQKLSEVEQLSERNRQVQMEKQLLLADQNTRLEQQVNERTAALNRSLAELKQTQNQLIQSAKMASLGELTAGIAHEIQNPLNFVNNFSEVSVELIAELKEEMNAGHNGEVLSIADDINQNLEKIHHHGKRADSIVKAMLEHSRTSAGQKEPTDLNKLADEYLQLAYHGMRAKDKSFNARLILQFQQNLPPVNLIPQNIGRVLLNLFNNAFYAVGEKKKTAGPDYEPTVEVSTFTTNDQVQLVIKDNGHGIPENIRDKIMQPFFTTKPTGVGTGLGLSLSYDIVVNEHGGKIQVDSIEREGTIITVMLPE